MKRILIVLGALFTLLFGFAACSGEDTVTVQPTTAVNFKGYSTRPEWTNLGETTTAPPTTTTTTPPTTIPPTTSKRTTVRRTSGSTTTKPGTAKTTDWWGGLFG
ncbi:MAG: hypothetical protein LBR73_01140 [Oscillospiraceae bacterium]|nr:hypothetical protein [Oscillospiraceae bacterium]